MCCISNGLDGLKNEILWGVTQNKIHKGIIAFYRNLDQLASGFFFCCITQWGNNEDLVFRLPERGVVQMIIWKGS